MREPLRRSAFTTAAIGALLAGAAGGVGAQSDRTFAEVFEVTTDPSVSYSLPEFWAATFPEIGSWEYRDPAAIGAAELLDGATTACGGTPLDITGNAVYCAADERITFDPALLEQLHAEYGPAASIAVLAHEWGHHVQAQMARPSVTQRSELQADCYAGMYVGHLVDKGVLSGKDVLGSLASTEGAGDDALSAPSYLEWHDSGMHGDSHTRRQAFGTGYSTGDPHLCLAYRQWTPQPPLVLSWDSSSSAARYIELPAGSFSEVLSEWAHTIETPEAYVQIHSVRIHPGTSPADAFGDAFQQAWGTDDVIVEQVVEGWLEVPGWASAPGARGFLYSETDDGLRPDGEVGIQLHPSGEADLFIAISTSSRPGDPFTPARHALDSIGWGYCDYDAPAPDNCAPR